MNSCLNHRLYNAFCDGCRRAAARPVEAPLKKFWVVWSPSGPSNPTKQHDTEPLAIAEAERLAKVHGGMDFYVMEAKSKSSLPPPPPTITTRLV